MKKVFHFNLRDLYLSLFLLSLFLIIFIRITGPAYQMIAFEQSLIEQIIQKTAFVSCDYLNDSKEEESTHILLCNTQQQTSLVLVVTSEAKVLKRVMLNQDEIQEDMQILAIQYPLNTSIKLVYKNQDMSYLVLNEHEQLYIQLEDLSVYLKVRL